MSAPVVLTAAQARELRDIAAAKWGQGDGVAGAKARLDLFDAGLAKCKATLRGPKWTHPDAGSACLAANTTLESSTPDSPQPLDTNLLLLMDVSSTADRHLLRAAADELDALRAEVAKRRRIVQITSIDDCPCVLCSDGTVWKFHFGSWTEYPALPGAP